MSTSLMRSECRKFAPNIFNKSKCTNCFRQKEEHSAEALESNRASRKVAKYGYLFVAPGWDFSNPLNRTKRWQRRWFVLYDDGELSYSVDEHPETVPQASIDMNKVLEVADAEDVTGNAFSLAITAPDRVHFVKGTCREEYRSWSDVLSVFPRSKGRHKRNATFPGGQTTSIHQPSPTIRASTPSEGRPRFNSCHTEPPLLRHPPTTPWDVTPPVDTRKVYRDQPAASTSPPTRDKIQPEEKIRTRRVLNREKRGIKSGRSFSEDFSGMLPTWRDHKLVGDTQTQNEVSRRILFDYDDDSKREEKLKDIADSITRPRYRRHQYHHNVVKPTRDSDCSEEEQKKSSGVDHTDSSGDKLVRGDPDGCGLDISTQRYSPSSELRVDLPAEDLLNIKKGWLMKQGLSKEWNKHWFVLHGAALMYYRDPTAEDKGILDGVIDLSGVCSVTEVQVARNYGFQTTTWDDRRYVLSAVTAGIRNNWMSAIRRAASLQEPPTHDTTLSVGEKLERELDTSQLTPGGMSSCVEREPSIVPSTPLTPRSILFSSDEEYRTASEGGRRESEDWGESLTPLPPSPPLNRTPISRVKEKARSRSTSRSRVYKRSRSSPPSSRHSTLDSIRADDLLLACGELPESDAEESTGVESIKSSLFDSADSQSTEIEELKRQLSGALCEVGNAEKELLKLKHHKTEILALEKQVKDLLTSLERTEVQLEQRTREVAELEQLKQSYKALLEEHEELLARWRQQAVGPDWRGLYQQAQERYRQETEEWQRKLTNAENALEQTSQRCELLGQELSNEQDSVQQLRGQVADLSERLARGIEENESLYRRVRAAGGGLSASRERGRSVDSLSDLTNIDLDLNLSQMDKERVLEEYDELRGRFEKAVQEIRAMKRELRESHALYDDLELVCITLRQDAKRREDADRAQASLMASRIEDLTLKLSAAEKQVRGLKQKLAKSESREKRRSLSLKGRESFQICKELEEKLGELEAKILALETGKPLVNGTVKSSRVCRSESPQQSSKKEEDSLKASSSRLRRKSLDSATSSEPMKVLIRLTSLEAKVAKATEKIVKSSGEQENSQAVAVNIESPQESSELEELLSKSRDKVQECLSLITSLKKSASNKSDMGDNFSSLEQCLSEVKDILQQCNARCGDMEVVVDDVQDAVKDSVQCVVSRLENVLRTKLSSVLEKRDAMRKAGTLNNEAHVRLLAEKLAYETVLVQRIAQAVSRCEDGSHRFRKWVMDNEILESSRLIAALKSKLSGKDDNEHCCETSVEYLTRVLSQKLLLQRQLALQNSSVSSLQSDSGIQSQPTSRPSSGIIELLLKRQRELDVRVREYRTSKLNQLAQALANETLSNTNENKEMSASSVEDRMIREAWSMAQEAVNRELIQAEISHVTMRCGQMYEANLAAEQEAMFTFLGNHRSILEQWSDSVEEILRQEMESGIEELTKKYEDYLSKWKNETSSKRKSHHDEDAKQSRKLLMEFADVTAHKALVDARIAMLLREAPSVGSPSIKSGENKGNIRENVSGLLSSDPLLSQLDDNRQEEFLACAEFEYLFEGFAKQCTASLLEDNYLSGMKSTKEQESIEEVMKSLQCVEDGLEKLRKSVTSVEFSEEMEVETEKSCSEATWDNVNSKCTVLREQMSSLTEKFLHCHRCQQLQEAVRRLGEEHEDQLQELRLSHDREMVQLRGELELQHRSLVCQHEQEQAQLKERARRLERRLGTLDSEYTQQVDNLRAAYQKTLSAGLERDVQGEENVRQRYQAEIEQLRALCEKGLVAMENSHRRIIAELEEKHRQELEQMRLEKEQALAEETQATLAALDAMRKAHETEVQKEIAKFKAEFIKKMQSTHDIGALHKEHEAEMEEIKKEILSLSEKYSVKCVESAALEEQLSSVQKQLARAQQHILQLDARNKQLRAHLVAEANETSDEAVQLLQQRDQELSRLQQELNTARAHGSELSALCAHLCAEGRRGDRTAAWNRLQQLTAFWPPRDTGTAVGGTHGTMNNNTEEPPALSRAELTRSPKQSCPTKSRQSTFLSVAPLPSTPASPLGGMVAERKKLFEH
ncbi:protein outspread [Anabrus simplex]|uniref:protein outspread n=1 Tax=Anabrus simplex TaxID=316456 RepID=UPI0035A3B024